MRTGGSRDRLANCIGLFLADRDDPLEEPPDGEALGGRQLGRAVIDPGDERLVDLARRLDDLWRRGQDRAPLVKWMWLATDVAGPLQPVQERGHAAGGQKEALTELAGSKATVTGEVRQRGGLRFAQPEAARDAPSMALGGERFAVQQIPQPLRRIRSDELWLDKS